MDHWGKQLTPFITADGAHFATALAVTLSGTAPGDGPLVAVPPVCWTYRRGATSRYTVDGSEIRRF